MRADGEWNSEGKLAESMLLEPEGSLLLLRSVTPSRLFVLTVNKTVLSSFSISRAACELETEVGRGLSKLTMQ